MQQKDQTKKLFERKKIQKSVVKNPGWTVKEQPQRYSLPFFGKNWTKSPETKKMRKGQVGVDEEKIEKSYELKV